MLRGTRKLCRLKVRRYSTRLIGLNEYLAFSPGEKASDRISETVLNEILFNSMPNGWSKQAYFQGFDCKILL